MTPFRDAQAADPFDSAPTLIWADWLEEQGDAIAAGVLRGLAGSEMASMHALAIAAALVSVPLIPDSFGCEYGLGRGDSLQSVSLGHEEPWSGPSLGCGVRDKFGYDSGEGYVEGHGMADSHHIFDELADIDEGKPGHGHGSGFWSNVKSDYD